MREPNVWLFLLQTAVVPFVISMVVSYVLIRCVFK